MGVRMPPPPPRRGETWTEYLDPDEAALVGEAEAEERSMRARREVDAADARVRVMLAICNAAAFAVLVAEAVRGCG